MYFDFVNVFIFLAFGAFFVVLNVSILSRLLRPTVRDAAKETTYECGEPPVGSGWVRFDIRFYTVALVFLIFDVEVAFLYPWAILFKDAKIADARCAVEVPVAGLAETSSEALAAVLEKLPGKLSLEKKPHGALEVSGTPGSTVKRSDLASAFAGTKLAVDENGFLGEGKVRLTASGSAEPEAVAAALDGLKTLGLAATRESAESGSTTFALTVDEPGKVTLRNVDDALKGAKFQLSQVEWVPGPGWRSPLFLFLEMLIFVLILLVGFVYIWVKGDLSWIKTTDIRGAQAADAARARELAELGGARG